MPQMRLLLRRYAIDFLIAAIFYYFSRLQMKMNSHDTSLPYETLPARHTEWSHNVFRRRAIMLLFRAAAAYADTLMPLIAAYAAAAIS